MTETFEIAFVDYNHYKILQQPERSFSFIYDIYIWSTAYPDSTTDAIWLRGDDHERDDLHVRIFPKHIRALEKLCNFKHWRFVACL